MTRTKDGETLAALRDEIDGIDAALHRLLIERGAIIDRLIAAKSRAGGGSAFRPAREADMMRRLVTRHRGILPLDTVESIWRIIISTFTFVQAPYSVHADISDGDAPMRDAGRFHFGFTVPLVPHDGAGAVIAAVAAAPGDLGLVRAGDCAPWWDALACADAPKVIARLPFVERLDHSADLPLYVVAKPLLEAALHDVLLHAVTLRGDTPAPPSEPITVVAKASTPVGTSLLLSTPEGVTPADIAATFAAAGHEAPAVAFIGSHAARFEIEASPPPYVAHD